MMKRYFKCLVFYSAAMMVFISNYSCCGKKGIKYMPTPKEIEQTFDRIIEPKIAPIDPGNEHGEYRTNVFAVPFKNAVGTLDLHNSISLIRFDDEGVKIDQLKKYDPSKFPYDSHDEFGSIPLSNHEIFYWSIKDLIILNFEKNDNVGIGSKGYSDDFEYITLLDRDQSVFLCKIDAGHKIYRLIQPELPLNYSNDSINKGYVARKIIAEKQFEQGQIIVGGTDSWINNKTIFVYETPKKTMMAFNDSLKQVQHPLVDVINKSNLKLLGFAVHPKLPFAVAMNSIDNPITGKSTWFYFLIRWQLDDEKARIIPFLLPLMKSIGADTTKLFLFDFQFSPDGKWLLIKDGTKNFDNPDLFVYPIDEKDPLYLGQPWYLGHAFREGAKQQSACWIADPCSYVVSDGMCVYKWEMPTTKQK